jgi:hypothetical protein
MVIWPRAGGRLAGPDVEMLADDLMTDRESDLADEALHADAQEAQRGKPGLPRRIIDALRRAGRH